MSSRVRLAIAGIIVAIAVALLWQRPWRSSSPSQTPVAGEPATPTSVGKARESRPRAMAPATIAGTTGEPLRLARATTEAVIDAPTGRFAGSVINWGSGAPVPGAELVFRGSAGAITITADADGRFQFEPPELGGFGLASISAEGFLPYAPAWGAGLIDVRARAQVAVSGLVFYLTPAIKYRGRVVDRDKTPVAGASISIVSTGTGQFELMPIAEQFTSDADGNFTFSAPDNSVLEARADERGVGRAMVDPAVQISHEMTIVIDGEVPPDATATVSVTVVDPAGEPVAGALIRGMVPRGDGMLRPRAVADENGNAELELPASSRVRLIASAADFSSTSQTVSLGAAGSRLEERMTLGKSASLRGRVVGEGGSAVPSFTVVVSQPVGVARRVIKTASFFDAEGRFEITGLREGVYRVSAAAYGFAPAQPVPASASFDESAEGVSITLPLGGTLVGLVKDSVSGDPLPLARVSVEGQMGGGDSALPIASSVVTDDDGRFELAGLPPGRASVIAGAADHHSRIVGGLSVESGARIGPLDIELTPTKEGERPQLELAGIGAQLAGNEDGLQVQRLIDGGGAIEAGIVVGDIIVAVDGTEVAKVGMSAAIGLIRGPVDTPVELRIRRADGNEVSLTAVRRKIRA